MTGPSIPTAAHDARRPIDWAEHAACRREDPEAFFPAPDDPIGTADARQVCHSCPVQQACLDDALRLEHGLGPSSRWGVRGGLTARERHLEARQRTRRAARERAAQPPPEPHDDVPRWHYVAEMGLHLLARGYDRATTAAHLEVSPGWLRECLRRHRDAHGTTA